MLYIVILLILQESIEKQINTLLTEAVSIDDKADTGNNDYKLPEPAFGENKNFPNASAALDLKFSIDKGRHIVANRDISKGQILFVERPFAFVLLDNDDSDAVCANCCKSKGDVPVP